jgi:hypothetical protein
MADTATQGQSAASSGDADTSTKSHRTVVKAGPAPGAATDGAQGAAKNKLPRPEGPSPPCPRCEAGSESTKFC